MSADDNRNLLFGVVALQTGLLNAEQFALGCTLWAKCKNAALP
jgi:hypothetical protein